MIIARLLSDPSGDIPVGTREAALPFKVTPNKNHPFFTLNDYFQTIETFTLTHCRNKLADLIRPAASLSESSTRIEKLIIRSEKHGAFYHIASIEPFFGSGPLKFAVLTALSKRGKELLEYESEIISYLDDYTGLHYLPQFYLQRKIPWNKGGKSADLVMVLAEWLGDYFEWHIHPGSGGRGQEIRIWDMTNGYRSASPNETHHIFREAAKILTLYYDPSEYRRIRSWHHGAGDFVVKTEKGQTRLKLTTVRRYEPGLGSHSKGPSQPMIALVYFFLNLTIRMRLDRINGIGDAIWAREDWFRPVVEGFIDGLKEKGLQRPAFKTTAEDVIPLLRSFSWEEIKQALLPLLDLYQEESIGDFTLIHQHLEDHALCLHRILQEIHG